MGIISKIDDVKIVSVNKPNGIAKSTISKITGQSKPTFTDGFGVELDGTNDYVDITLSSDPINKTRGTISMWVRNDSATKSTTKFVAHDYPNTSNTNDAIAIDYYLVSTNVWAVRAYYKSTVDGTSVTNVCNAKAQSPDDHGVGFKRIASTYGTATSDTELNFLSYVSDDEWHHIAVTWDVTETLTVSGTDYDGKMKFYLDGVLKQEGQSTSPSHNGTGVINDMQPMTATLSRIYLGIRSQGTSHTYSQFADGTMNDISIFDTDLDITNITAIYNNGQPGNLSENNGNYTGLGNLVGYWKFEENTGTTVYDQSKNSNNGVLTSGAAYTALSYPLNSVSYNFEGETTQEGATSDWSPGNSWVNGASAVNGTYWARDSNKTVKGWNLGQDGTSSGNTGPSGGVNPTDGSHYTTTNLDKYMYTETSAGRNANCFVARMPSYDSDSMVDSGNDLDLKFWVHAFGNQIGDLYVYVSTATTSNHTAATELAAYESFSGYTANSSVWQQKTISLNSYRDGTPFYIYFVSQNGTGFRADLAVDAVQIIES